MLCIIGCGNPLRGDDGVGSVVVRELQSAFDVDRFPMIKIEDAGTDGLSVIYRIRGADALIVVDASRTGAEAGSVFCVPGEELIEAHSPSYNLHDFRWDHALFAAQKILGEQFPKKVTTYLIEGENFEAAIGLTPSVARAAAQVIKDISAVIQDYTRQGAA